MSKILFISNVSNRVSSFVTAGISAAHNLNIDFYQAANWKSSTKTKISAYEQEYDIKIKNVSISRNPFATTNITAYKELAEFVKQEKIDYIHCNTPVGGLLGRLVGKKCKVKKVIYQAHGFHFYKGAPLLNWLLYYPVEKWLAHYTDALITINQEDYTLAKRKMKLRNGGKIYYVPGAGVDPGKFSHTTVDKGAKRRELGIPENAVVLLSVGELNRNKNHETVIRAIADMNVYYVIAGRGELQTHLENLIDALNLQDRVKLLGFRSDVRELYKIADIFAFPSYREGLPLSMLEAMASGLPCVASRIRGNTDLLENAEGGFLCDLQDVSGFAEGIKCLAANAELREKMGKANLMKIQKFSTETVIKEMQNIYATELLAAQ